MSVCLWNERVRLVPYGVEHDRQTVEWLNDPAMHRTFGLTRRVDRDAHRAWVESARDLLFWAILDRENVHQGNFLLHVTPRHGSAYLQMYIGRAEARGRGLGAGALAVAIRYGFREAGLHRIWLHTLPGNEPAVALYRKAGFVEEGTERESILRDGSFHSQLRWSLLASDWERLQP